MLPPEKSTLMYYKSDEDFRKGGEPLGSVDCAGAHMFLKEVTKEKHYRFTIRSKERELKLRAGHEVDYQASPGPTPPHGRPSPPLPRGLLDALGRRARRGPPPSSRWLRWYRPATTTTTSRPAAPRAGGSPHDAGRPRTPSLSLLPLSLCRCSLPCGPAAPALARLRTLWRRRPRRDLCCIAARGLTSLGPPPYLRVFRAARA